MEDHADAVLNDGLSGAMQSQFDADTIAGAQLLTRTQDRAVGTVTKEHTQIVRTFICTSNQNI